MDDKNGKPLARTCYRRSKGIEIASGALYTAAMLPRRFMRIASAVVAILMAAAVGLGFDFHLGMNITETLLEPVGLCF